MRYEKQLRDNLLKLYPFDENVIDFEDKKYLRWKWFNDPRICQYNSHSRHPFVERTEPDPRVIVWGITFGPYYIGNIALDNIDHLNRSAEISIIIGNEDYHNKGIGKEAFNIVIGHAFNELNLNRIWFGCDIRNKAMQKIGDSLGFEFEGRQRKAFFKAGAYHDILNYGLLRDEPNETEVPRWVWPFERQDG